MVYESSTPYQVYRVFPEAETTMHIAAFDEYIWAHEFVRAIIKAEVFAGNVLYIIIKDGRLVDAYYDKDSD